MLAFLTAPAVVAEILVHLGLPSHPRRLPRLVLLPGRGCLIGQAYLTQRKPGETAFRPLALDVLEIGADGLIAEIVTFPLEERVEAFGLPEVL